MASKKDSNKKDDNGSKKENTTTTSGVGGFSDEEFDVLQDVFASIFGDFSVPNPKSTSAKTKKSSQTSTAKSSSSSKKQDSKPESKMSSSAPKTRKGTKKNCLGLTDEDVKSLQGFFSVLENNIDNGKTDSSNVTSGSTQKTKKPQSQASQKTIKSKSQSYSLPISSLLKSLERSKGKVGCYNFSFGTQQDMPVIYDLSKLPHVILEQASGSGKTTVAKMILLSLMNNFSPSELKVAICEEKEYQTHLEYGEFLDLPYISCANVLSLEGWLYNLLSFIDTELENRKQRFLELGVSDFNSFNALRKENGEETLPYLVAVIDELKLQAKSENDYQNRLILHKILNEAKDFGISLIVVTQDFADGIYLQESSLNQNVLRVIFSYDTIKTKTVVCKNAKNGGEKSVLVANASATDLSNEIKVFSKNLETSTIKLSTIDKKEIVKEYKDILSFAISRKFLSASMLRSEKGLDYVTSRKVIALFEKLGLIAPSIEYRPHDTLITEEQLKKLIK